MRNYRVTTKKTDRGAWNESAERTRQREELRRSNAAGPHKARRKDEEIPELDEDEFDDVEFDLFDWLGKDLDPDA